MHVFTRYTTLLRDVHDMYMYTLDLTTTGSYITDFLVIKIDQILAMISDRKKFTGL